MRRVRVAGVGVIGKRHVEEVDAVIEAARTHRPVDVPVQEIEDPG